MIWSRGAAANTTIFAAAKRDSAIFMLFRYLHAFLSPEPFNAFVIRLPATLAQGIINSWATPSRAATGNSPHLRQNFRLVRRSTFCITLRTARLAKHLARPTFRNTIRPQATTHVLYSASLPLRAHQFPFAASFRISMSKACSATSFFSRAFSFSSDLSCLAISGAIPPYF